MVRNSVFLNLLHKQTFEIYEMKEFNTGFRKKKLSFNTSLVNIIHMWETEKWSSPLKYYRKILYRPFQCVFKLQNSKEVEASDALKELHNKFQYELVERGERAKACRPKYDPPQRKIKLRKHKPIGKYNFYNLHYIWET